VSEPLSSSEPPPRPAASERGWLLAALAVVLALGLPSLLYPLGPDHGVFVVVGDVWLRGGLPYRDAWDIKPPGVLAAYALALGALGRTVGAIWTADLLTALLTAAGLFWMARRHGAVLSGFLAAVLFGGAYFLGFDFYHSAQAESFAAPATLLFVYGALRGREPGAGRWWAVSGPCLGVLILFKTTYVGYGLLALVAAGPLLRRGERFPLREALLFLGAMLLPLAGMLLYFGAHNALGELRELYEAQAGYASGLGGNFWARAGTETLKFVTHPALVISWLAAGLALALPEVRRRPDFAVLATWLVLAVAMTAAQRRFYWYQWLPVLPPLALLAGAALGAAASAAAAQRSRTPRRVLAALLAAAVLVPVQSQAGRFTRAWRQATGAIDPEQYWRSFDYENGYSYWECMQVAEHIRARSGPEEPLLVYAYDPAIYFLADRRCPTRHISNAPIVTTVTIPEKLRRQWTQEMDQAIAADPPRYLVFYRYMVGARQDLPLSGHAYVLETTYGKFAVFRRKG